MSTQFDRDRTERLKAWIEAKMVEETVRAKRVVSVNDVAALLNISPASLTQYRNGDRSPDYRNQVRMALRWGAEIFEIMGNNELSDQEVMRAFEMFRGLDDHGRKETIAYLEKKIGEVKKNNNAAA